MHRDDKDVAQMQLPPCPIPRPGDSVVWYNDSMRMRGTLEGHGPDGTTYVLNQFQNHSILRSFDLIRLADPNSRRGPAWQYLPPTAKILVPSSDESNTFGKLLARRTPPGPQYQELVEEIWSRGFEVLLVGGTVRDVLAGVGTHDVDLVTTMPLSMAVPLLESMYRHKPSVDAENGFVRLGGTPASGDPFIDLKMFSHYSPGNANAIFGADFIRDMEHRDFSCNATYYDPINRAIIDPSGNGVDDAEAKLLQLVCNRDLRSPFHRGQIAIRFFKFLTRGFKASDTTRDEIRDGYLPDLPAMHSSHRITYVRAQLLSKTPRGTRLEVLDSLKVEMVAFGAEREWEQLFEPLRDDMLAERRT